MLVTLSIRNGSSAPIEPPRLDVAAGGSAIAARSVAGDSLPGWPGSIAAGSEATAVSSWELPPAGEQVAIRVGILGDAIDFLSGTTEARFTVTP